MTHILTYWFLLILACIILAIGLAAILTGSWAEAGALFTFVLVLLVLVLVTRKEKS